MRPAVLPLCASVLLLGACDPSTLDVDLRDVGRGFDTSSAVQSGSAPRPQPDNRGVISYPNYQVVVAQRGDTVADVADRVGLSAEEIARYNGIPVNASLNYSEVLVLPKRVAEPSPATGAISTGPIRPSDSVDIQSLAGNAIARAEPAPSGTTTPAPVQTGEEPVRHKVEAGETAYSISRLYGVSAKSLGEWNGLGSDLAVRTGQYLLIPVAAAKPKAAEKTTMPGEGSPTPAPPSASTPLPAEKTQPVAKTTVGAAPGEPKSPDLAKDATATSTSAARMTFPVQGSIVRDFQKGKSQGIDIAASAGATVKAAADGSVATITRDTDQVPIIVLRHPGNLLTVYANVGEMKVSKGQKVKRGQPIGTVRAGNSPYLHFEVREGTDAVDPAPYFE